MKLQMSAAEMADTRQQVNHSNKKIGVNFEGEKNTMGKDAFLKLLVTQLKHQDPTKPMEDREFMAQMAQFSSLEQMNNLNKEMRSLIRSAESSEAYGLIGKEIESFNRETQKTVTGPVSSIRYKDDQVRLMVNGEEVQIKDIHSVKQGALNLIEEREIPVKQ
jgi:flagellar basal-body rod modification protein FlgD